MSAAETITIRDTYTEAVQGEVISNQFSYTVFDLKNFVGTLALTAPILGPSQEEVTIPQMLDLVGLDILYYCIIQR